VKRQNVALPVNAFVLYFASCDYCAGGRKQLMLSTVLGYVRQWTYCSTWCHQIWIFLFL